MINSGEVSGVVEALEQPIQGDVTPTQSLTGEVQPSSGVGGVRDVLVNEESVVDANKVAHIDLTPYAEKEDVYDKQTIDTALEGKADIDDIPTALSQLDNDADYVQDADYVHTDNNFTDEDKTAIGNIPENITDLSDVAVDNIQNGQVLKWDATQEKFVNADESGGGGDVTDVKVNGTSVVDPITGEADIDLTGKADKVLDAVVGDFAVLLANGNVGNSGKSANDMASKAEMSVTTNGDQTTIQLKSGTSATVINQHQDISGKADKSSLGTAAEKDSTALIVVGSTDLAEAGAVREAIDSAVASSYHHAGTKTCAELVASLLVKANEGNVYNMTDSGVTTADFIEGAGKPIEEGANVGIAKIAENTYKFDLLSGFIDTSNFIEKSVTSGFVKNDGSIDTNTYQQTEAGKGLSTNDYDNTDKAKVDKINTTTTSISGNPISISGLKSNQLAINPIITFEPIQAGSGTPSPSNVRVISGYDKVEVLSCGVNVWNEEWESGDIDNATGNPVPNSGTCRTVDFIRVIPNATYYCKGNLYIHHYDINKNHILTYANKNNTTYDIPSSCAYIKFVFVGSTYNKDISLNIPATDTSYHAYDKTTDISESLGQTLYRFAYDVRIGKITTQYVYTTFSGASDETIERIGTNVSGKWRYVLTKTGLVTIPWSDGTHKSGMLTANMFEELTNTDTNDCTVGIHYRANGAGNSFIAYFGDNYTTVDDVKALLQTTPLQVVYAIPTITTIQLTPHEISLLKDYAYVSTNGTSIALDYHNGEIASLADVSQLGETVNALGDSLKNVDVKVYYSGTNENWKIYRIGRLRILTAWNCPVGKMLTYLDDVDKPVDVYDSMVALIDSRMSRFRIQTDGGISCYYIYTYGGTPSSYNTSSTEKVFTSFAYVAKA